MRPFPKALISILCVCLVTATTYLYISQEWPPEDSNDTDDRGAVFTAMMSLNVSKNHMDAKYDRYKLSTMYQLDDDRWFHTYIINNGSAVTYIDTLVSANGSVSSYPTSYRLEDAQSWYYPRDTQGFDVELLKIDSDTVERIIINHLNETEHNSSIRLKLRLETSILQGIPMWTNTFTLQIQMEPFYKVKVNATSGDIIDFYKPHTPEETCINIGDFISPLNETKITAFEGLEYARGYLKTKYDEFSLSKISSIRSWPEAPGRSSAWQYRFVIVDMTNNKLTHEEVTICANGTLSYSRTTYELYDLYFGIPHGFFDMDGYSFEQLKIDSDEAHEIIIRRVENETWYDLSVPLSLSLFGRISDSDVPIWDGSFYTTIGYHYVKINAETGEIIEYYSSP